MFPFTLLHSHADTEDFFVISGELDCLRKENEDHKLVKANTGDFVKSHAMRLTHGATYRVQPQSFTF